MASRLELQEKLEELLGSGHVYFNPPETVKMEYPAIVYHLQGKDTIKANDTTYKSTNRYEIVVIAKRFEHPVIDKLLALPYCRYDRPYSSDNLCHEVLTLYF